MGEKSGLPPESRRLEGVLALENDLAICISQPRLDLIAVTQAEIDGWFVAQGFQIVTTAAYYRAEDNPRRRGHPKPSVIKGAMN